MVRGGWDGIVREGLEGRGRKADGRGGKGGVGREG